MQKAVNTVTLVAGGDVGPVHKPVDRLAERILPVLQEADLRFTQCERTYSQRGRPPQWSLGSGGHHSRLDPEMASVFKAAGANVVSLASSNIADQENVTISIESNLFGDYKATNNGVVIFPIFELSAYAIAGLISNLLPS